MAELKEFKCPACGGALEFDSKVQKMKCPYCDTEFEVEAVRSYEEEVSSEKDEDISWDTSGGTRWHESETEGMKVYTCESCGGEIVGDGNTGSTSCPYCGNPVLVAKNFSGDLRPDYVIPFKLGKKAAKNAYLKHIQKKPLLPGVFKEENHIEEIKGIYVPFWLFDAEAQAKVRYRATRTRMWSDSEYNYTKTSVYSVRREGEIGFENVPADGSSKMPDDLMEAIEPFYFKDAADFNTAYLAGYFADKYDVEASSCEERANERIRQSTEDAFRDTVKGYSSVIPEHTGISLSKGELKYALYPVWILNTVWKGKKYTFAMNGQTGKLTGDLPVDRKAFWKWFAGITVAAGAFIYGIASAVNVLGAEIPDERQLPRFVDGADLVTEEESWTLEEKLDELSEKYQCDIAIVTTEDTGEKNVTAYADDFYDYNGYGMGEGNDGILLLVDMGDREWAMSTSGFGIGAFTDSGQEYISDKFRPYLTKGDYMEAFTVYADLCGEFLEQAKNGEPYREGNLPREPLSVWWIFGSLAGGALAAFIITGFMKMQMKGARKQKNAGEYIKPGSLKLTGSSDIYLYSNVTRTPKPKESDFSDGGGSSTHTSSSGSTHGGSSGSF